MVLLDEYQMRRATSALLKHVQRSRSGSLDLLEEDGDVIIAQISLHKIPERVTAKPIPITIPHPLRRQDDCDMCLFVKDDAKAWIKEMVEKEPMVGLAKIIKLQKLRTQFREYKNRRELLSQYDMFLADDRILPMLTKALGKTFFKVKKQPVPISLRRKSSLAAQIDRARKNAFLCGSNGDCWIIKLANTNMTEDQVLENLMTGLPAVVDKIPRKWKNVKSINIKTSDSIALPVYSHVGDIPNPSPPQDTEVTVDEQAQGKKGRDSKIDTKKTRKPRPLIRQQLQRIKEDMMAEKRATASSSKETIKPKLNKESQSKDKAVTKSKGEKRPVSESTEGPDKVREGGKVDKKSKQKSVGLTSVAVKGSAVAKRRKAEVVLK